MNSFLAKSAFISSSEQNPTQWPFPLQPLPNKPGKPKFNPNNHEDAPL